MHQAILQQLGLSQNEARIYHALLVLKKATVSEIASYTNLYRRNVYDAINRLVAKNMAYLLLQSEEKIYAPVEPDNLMDVVRDQEIQLAGILPTLRKKHYRRDEAREAYIYRGHEGFKNYMRDILRVGKDVYFVGGTLAWFDPSLNQFTREMLQEAKKKGMRFHCVFYAAVKERGGVEVREFTSHPKYLPKSFSSNSVFLSYGDCVVTYTGVYYKKVSEDVVVFVLRDKVLAESYRQWFRYIYDFCPV
jgi:sugar-specific transcriptional regulator TrmB